MLWVDNFSKTLARQCPSMAKGVYSACLWTGMAVFSDPRHAGLDDRVKMVNGRAVPAMPDNITQFRQQVLAGLKFVLDEGRNYLRRSLVHKFRVNNIPLKILDAADRAHHQHTDAHHSMRIVHPLKLLDKNIGSNPGLVSILKEDIHDEHGMGTDECKTYVNLNVDENIFWRILKVSALSCVCALLWYHCPQQPTRSCTINRNALGNFERTQGFLLLGGTVTNGRLPKSCKCLAKMSLHQCFITCFLKGNTLLAK